MPYLSLNTWSVHRSLGSPRIAHWNLDKAENNQQMHVGTRLIDLPSLAAKRGIRALDVCHFHFPSTSETYLVQLRQAFQQAGVMFYTLLVDHGDISTPNESERAYAVGCVERWIDIASAVGAERVRVVAGESAPTDASALRTSAEALNHLVEYANPRGVRVITENFRELASTPKNCLYLRSACNERIGLIADFGNFKSEGKYGDLAEILPFSENIHAKGHYNANGLIDVPEFERCLSLLGEANYDGPITMVYDGPGDEWDGIARVQAVVESYL